MSNSKSASELSEQEVVALSETDEWVPIGETKDRSRLWQDAARKAIKSKLQSRPPESQGA